MDNVNDYVKRKRGLILNLWAFLLMTMVIGNHIMGKSRVSPGAVDARSIVIRSAGEQKVSGSYYIATDVEISWGSYRLYAQYLELDYKTNRLTAKGRVTMVSENTVISGDQLWFDLEKQTGEMVETYGQLNPKVRYTTKKLKQADKETLKFNKMNFTSCSQCVPRWKITCSNGKIKKDKYIEMSHSLFKIKNIPVFYFPYLRYPLTPDGRATGILFPRIGQSSRSGFFMMNGFYWDIKPYMDLTLNVDHYSGAGLGVGQEFRYLFGGAAGNVQFYYFNYNEAGRDLLKSISSGVSAGIGTSGAELSGDLHPGWDYLLKVKHNQKLPFLKTRVLVDIDRQSNSDFLRIISDDFNGTQKRIFKSSMSITSYLGALKISLLGSEVESFYPVDGSFSLTRYLPKVEVFLNHKKYKRLPGYFTLTAGYSIISKEGKRYKEEEEIFTNATSRRVYINPGYSVNIAESPWLLTNLALDSRLSFYPQSRDPQVTKEVVILDKPLHLGNYSARVTVTGPMFTRVYISPSNKVKHIFQPKLTINYTTGVNESQRARLVPGDRFDLPGFSYVQFSLTNRLLFKSKNNGKLSPVRDLLSYTVSQDYYLEPEKANYGRSIDGMHPAFSQLTHKWRLTPIVGFEFTGSLSYHHYLDTYTRVSLDMGYTGKGPVKGSFGYNRNINQYQYYNPEYKYNTETIGGSLNVDFPSFPIKLRSRLDYDIEHRILNHCAAEVTLDYQCIRFQGRLKLIKFTGYEDFRFSFGVSFGNLGTVDHFLGGK